MFHTWATLITSTEAAHEDMKNWWWRVDNVVKEKLILVVKDDIADSEPNAKSDCCNFVLWKCISFWWQSKRKWCQVKWKMVRLKIKLLVTFVSMTDFFFVLMTSWIPDIQLVFQDEKSCIRSFFPINFWFVFGLCFGCFLCRTIALVRRNLFAISEMGAHRDWFCGKRLGGNRNFSCQSSGKEKRMNGWWQWWWLRSKRAVRVVKVRLITCIDRTHHGQIRKIVILSDNWKKWIGHDQELLWICWKTKIVRTVRKNWWSTKISNDTVSSSKTRNKIQIFEIFNLNERKWGEDNFKSVTRWKQASTPLSLKTKNKNSNFEFTQVERGENSILNLLQEESRLVWTLSLKTEWKWKCQIWICTSGKREERQF